MGANYSGSIVKSGIKWAYGPIQGCWTIQEGPNKAMSKMKLREE